MMSDQPIQLKLSNDKYLIQHSTVSSIRKSWVEEPLTRILSNELAMKALVLRLELVFDLLELWHLCSKIFSILLKAVYHGNTGVIYVCILVSDQTILLIQLIEQHKLWIIEPLYLLSDVGYLKPSHESRIINTIFLRSQVLSRTTVEHECSTKESQCVWQILAIAISTT